MSLVAAAALVPVGGAHAEPVVVGAEGVASTHDVGMPAVAVPWRTLVKGTLTTNTLDNVWRATATLGGAVPPGETVGITWTPGRQWPAGCEPLLTITEQAATVAADNTVSIERYIEPGYFPETPSPEPTCLKVHIWTGNTVSDQLVGSMAPYSHLAGAEARPAHVVRVAAGRTTPVLVRVTSHVRGTSAVSIAGSGPGVRMKDLAVGPLGANQSRPVVARISARGVADTELAVTARDDLGSDSFDTSWEVFARQVEAQRPLPGRYANREGTLRFRVSEDNNVVRLRTTSVLCEGSNVTKATYPVEIHLPRNGATARVAQLGVKWLGAELMTVRSNVVRGSFFYGTPSCSSWETFVARRKG